MGLVGLEDPLPVLEPRTTTNVVSTIGTARTSSGKKRAATAAVFNRPCTETAAST
jgi:hypothetical protein